MRVFPSSSHPTSQTHKKNPMQGEEIDWGKTRASLSACIVHFRLAVQPLRIKSLMLIFKEECLRFWVAFHHATV
jgi:hypothetical protein